MRYYLAWALLVVAGAGMAALGGRVRGQHAAKLLAFAVWGAAMFALLWTVSSPPDYLSDFHKAYYPAGDAILHDRAHLYTKINPVTGYVNIPIVALLFVPLSQLTRHSADAVMTAIDLMVTLGAFAGLAAVSRLRGSRLALLGALFLANGPLYYSVREGNLTHFTLLLAVGALWCIDTKRGGLLGVLLATAAILKPPMILLAVPFLLRRTPRFLTGLAVTLAAVAVVSVVIFGIDLHLTWYRDTVAPYSRHPLGAYNVQSVDGFLARLFVGDHLTDWSVIESGALAFTVARLAFAAAVAVACFAVAWRARASSRPDVLRLELVIALCATLVIGPISWTHYYCMLLIPMALYLGGRLPVPDSPPWMSWLGVGTLLVSAPVRVPNASHALIGPVISRVVVSHYFYGALIFLAVLLAARWAIPVAPEADDVARDRLPAEA